MSEPQVDAYTEWLNSNPDTSEDFKPTFEITPDPAAEDPAAYAAKPNFFKTPFFFYGLIVAGGLSVFSMIYALSSLVAPKPPAVASAPADFNQMGMVGDTKKYTDPADTEFEDARGQRDGRLGGGKPATPGQPSKPPSGRVVTTVTRPATRIVYVRQPSRPAPVARSVESAPVPRPASVRQETPRVRPAPVPPAPVIPQEKPLTPEEQWAQSSESFYAPDSGQGPQVVDAIASSHTPPVATNALAVTPNKDDAIAQAIAIYDGTAPAPIPEQDIPVAEAPEGTLSAPVTKESPVNVASEPETAADYAQKRPQKAEQENLLARVAIPLDSTIKGMTMGMLSWNAQKDFPMETEIRIMVRSDFKQNGQTVIPRGSIAYAQAQDGTMGKYISASVTRIQTPSGQTYTIQPGLLTASNHDGFLAAKLEQPGRGGGMGRFLGGMARAVVNIGASSIAPDGDGIGDRLANRAIYSGASAVDQMIGGDGDRVQARGQIPSFYVIKAKTGVELVANGDIELI